MLSQISLLFVLATAGSARVWLLAENSLLLVVATACLACLLSQISLLFVLAPAGSARARLLAQNSLLLVLASACLACLLSQISLLLLLAPAGSALVVVAASGLASPLDQISALWPLWELLAGIDLSGLQQLAQWSSHLARTVLVVELLDGKHLSRVVLCVDWW